MTDITNRCRQWVKRHTAMYDMAKRLLLIWNSVSAYPKVFKRRAFKSLVDFKVLPFGKGLNDKHRSEKIVCSLTSYGRRVYLAHYTVVSLLMQKTKPDRLVLWLDKDNWHDANVPGSLRRLESFGLSIRFCDDLRSFKKLLPTLQEERDSVIVTADDDMYYPKEWLDGLYVAHRNRPDCILAYLGHRLCIDNDGTVLPYRNWDLDTSDECASHLLVPVGCMGVLYPPGALDRQVHDTDLIANLCPHSDDIWFWAMSVLSATPKSIVRRQNILGGRVRPAVIELYDTRCDKLANYNVISGGNDLVIKSVVDRFNMLDRLLYINE